MTNAVASLDEVLRTLVDERKKIDEAIRGIEAAKKILGDSRSVQAALPRRDAPPALPGMGRFSAFGPTEALLDFMRTNRGKLLSCPEIAKALVADGMRTKSTNPANMIRGICNRLAKEDRIQSEKSHGTTVFGIRS